MTKRIGVVVNPERTELADTFVDLLRGRGQDVDVVTPADPRHLGDAVDTLLAAGVDVLAAVGGDGTQRTAAERVAGTDVPLAVVPGGTVNLLARVIGIDGVDDVVAAISDGHRRSIDLGRVGDDVFVLNASTGWDATVIDRVDDSAKRFGRVGYAATGVMTWFRSRPMRVRVALDGEPWYDDRAMTVLVMNVGQRGSASIHVAPDASIDDGRLDVVVLRRHSLIGLLRTGWSIARGRPRPPRDVATGQAATIDVIWDRPVSVQRDGDECARAASTAYSVRPQALVLVVPPSDPPPE